MSKVTYYLWVAGMHFSRRTFVKLKLKMKAK